jgi:hypothetical protein
VSLSNSEPAFSVSTSSIMYSWPMSTGPRSLELDPRLSFLLCPAGRDCIGDGGLPAKEDRSLLVHVDRSVMGPCPGMRVSTSSGRMISSELSHWSTIARLPDITVAPTRWEQIGL